MTDHQDRPVTINLRVPPVPLTPALQSVLAAPPVCADHDDECPDVPDKVKCWLYAPEEGVCPYLQRETP